MVGPTEKAQRRGQLVRVASFQRALDKGGRVAREGPGQPDGASGSSALECLKYCDND
jgi:hypothetical protein